MIMSNFFFFYANDITHFCCLDFPFFFRITVPPEKISIRDESGIDRVSVVGPYNEGDFANLYCEVYGGELYYVIRN